MLPGLWALFTVVAAGGQTLRNALQRELTATLGTVGATHVRFLYGLPFGWLFLASAALIAAAAALVVLAGLAPEAEDGSRPGFASMVWFTMMRALNAGTVGGDSGGVPFLATMFGVTIGGIFLVSTLIGILTSGLEARIDSLRKGRSLVCEKDHILILGWSPQIFSIVSELCIANESRKDAAMPECFT